MSYVIVLKQDKYLTQYESSTQSDLNRLHEFWKKFNIDPKKYRGICREPLDTYWGSDKEVRRILEKEGTYSARIKMYEAIGYTEEGCFIPDLANARVVLEYLRSPKDYEIIQIHQDKYKPAPSTLGFDIATPGGDCTSLIGDTIVAPQWNGADPYKIIGKLKKLNKNLLFNTPEEADLFGEYCMEQDWVCASDYIPIQIDEVNIS